MSKIQLDRRRFLERCAAAGIASPLFPGALLAIASTAHAEDTPTNLLEHESMLTITPEMIDAAAAISGLKFSAEQKQMMLDGLNQKRDSVMVIRSMHLKNSTAPATIFHPVLPGMKLDTVRHPMRISTLKDTHAIADTSIEQLAFCTVRELAELIRTRKVTSTALTTMYLARLKRCDAKLHCVITLTEERALKQAAEADAEIAAGRYRGPLHGIPWGAKDLLAVKGYPTTWGAAGFETQEFEDDAEVVKRLDAAGAVLIAKLSMGALAQGDLWFGGRTRNPWNPMQGSSGSSAGSASAVSAGCVGFAIGTETLGSISSPATRCGATGLRPSFGLVPRTGAMALSWSMDKIGPICRAVEDCAIVLHAIHGPDGHDLSVQDAAFNWDAEFNWKKLRIGYLKSAFDLPAKPKAPPANATQKQIDTYKQQQYEYERAAYDTQLAITTLDALRKMGVEPKPVEMPHGYHFGDISTLLGVEAAAAFDELTRSGRDAKLNGQKSFDWPNSFRVARFYSAVDYIQAMRARTLANAAMTKLFEEVDVIVTPSGGTQLTATNLSGQPAIIVPNGLRGSDAPKPQREEDGALENTGGPGTPVSITFLGPLYSDAHLASFARAYQEHTSFHKLHPPLFVTS